MVFPFLRLGRNFGQREFAQQSGPTGTPEGLIVERPPLSGERPGNAAGSHVNAAGLRSHRAERKRWQEASGKEPGVGTEPSLDVSPGSAS